MFMRGVDFRILEDPINPSGFGVYPTAGSQFIVMTLRLRHRVA